jgi:hypothetical protein
MTFTSPPRRAMAWSIAIIAAVASGIACPIRADVLCDSEKGTLTFVPDPVDSSESWPPAAEYNKRCIWKDGTTVLIRYLRSLRRDPRGYESTVSVWVDGKKWVNAAITFKYENHEHSYRAISRIGIDANGLTTCTLWLHNATGDDADQPTGPEVCRTQSAATWSHGHRQHTPP